jgi:hypothetical protein
MVIAFAYQTNVDYQELLVAGPTMASQTQQFSMVMNIHGVETMEDFT